MSNPFLDQLAADAKAVFVTDFAETCIAMPKGRAPFNIQMIVDRDPPAAQGPSFGQRIQFQYSVEFCLADWGDFKPQVDQVRIAKTINGSDFMEAMTITEQLQANFPGLVRYKLN